MALPLGEMLLRAGKINQEQLEKALQHQEKHGGKLGEILLSLGFVKDKNVIDEALAKQLNIGRIKLTDIDIDPEVANLIPEETCRKFTVVAVIKVGKMLFVATSDPTNNFVWDTLKFLTGFEIQPVFAPKEEILSILDKCFGTAPEDIGKLGSAAAEDLQVVESEEEEEKITQVDYERALHDKPLVRLVNSIIADAVRARASDIHIEPFENRVRVRYRVDGVLHVATQLPPQMKRAIVSRIKILANLNISETRLPQDGRIKMTVAGKKVELRVSVVPCIFGEVVEIRIQDPEALVVDITKLGFPEYSLKMFNKAIHMPFGMVLVTGPTGCGKTTTIYSAVSVLNTMDVNISTVEDPVEFNIHGVNQVQVNPEVGLTFAAALRSFLRQDPNIIFVGEIRDPETADIATKAALTGHLVLSTLHTNDAPATITRLINMGLPPFLVASSVRLVISQRLVRVICPNCKEEYMPEPELLEIIGYTPEFIKEKGIKFYRGKGCPNCYGTGYKGRTGIFETLELRKDVQRLIVEGATELEIADYMAANGMPNLRYAALEKMNAGITTIEQVISETTA